MEYVDKQIEIEANERQAREKLQEVRKQVRHILSMCLWSYVLQHSDCHQENIFKPQCGTTAQLGCFTLSAAPVFYTML